MLAVEDEPLNFEKSTTLFLSLFYMYSFASQELCYSRSTRQYWISAHEFMAFG